MANRHEIWEDEEDSAGFSPFQNDADLLFGGELAAGPVLDLADDFFGVSSLGHGTLP